MRYGPGRTLTSYARRVSFQMINASPWAQPAAARSDTAFHGRDAIVRRRAEARAGQAVSK